MLLRAVAEVSVPEQLGQRQLVQLLLAALAEAVDAREGDGKIVKVESKRPRRLELGRVLDEPTLFQPEQDDVRIVGRQKPSMLRSCGNRRARAIVDLDEDAVKPRSAIFAPVDAKGELAAELIELADLHRRPERAGTKIEAQALVPIMGPRLQPADDEKVQQHQADGVGVGDSKQPPEARADPPQRIELG